MGESAPAAAAYESQKQLTEFQSAECDSTCGLMSLSSARRGISPSVTARPPQNGSTSRRVEWLCQIGRRYGTCHRLPPAHLSGGRRRKLSCSAGLGATGMPEGPSPSAQDGR